MSVELKLVLVLYFGNFGDESLGSGNMTQSLLAAVTSKMPVETSVP